jgi:hypothetical protein
MVRASCSQCRRFIRTAGRSPIEFSIQLLKGIDGAVEWVVAFIRDVTERYDCDKQLRAHLANLEGQSGRPIKS